jgi:hypothetical protein
VWGALRLPCGSLYAIGHWPAEHQNAVPQTPKYGRGPNQAIHYGLRVQMRNGIITSNVCMHPTSGKQQVFKGSRVDVVAVQEAWAINRSCPTIHCTWARGKDTLIVTAAPRQTREAASLFGQPGGHINSVPSPAKLWGHSGPLPRFTISYLPFQLCTCFMGSSCRHKDETGQLPRCICQNIHTDQGQPCSPQFTKS